jgi:hypothetical protein
MAKGGDVAKRAFAAMMPMGKIDVAKIEASYRQFLVTAEPVRRRRLWADGQSVWR